LPGFTAITAETIAKALGGRKASSGWIARCPAHDDRKPSLSIGESSGLWPENGPHPSKRSVPHNAAATNQPDHGDANRTEAALAIWEAATPAIGTPTPKTQARIIRADLTISAVMIMAPRSSRLAGGRR
jgi:putative DNA primase/helicase